MHTLHNIEWKSKVCITISISKIRNYAHLHFAHYICGYPP